MVAVLDINNNDIIESCSDMSDTGEIFSVLVADVESSSNKKNHHDTREECDCGVKFQQGQKEKHLKSKHHLSKTKGKKALLLRATKHVDEYECKDCGTAFTNETLYRNHLGSKTHRRNASELKSNTSGDASQCISEFGRKKYRSRQEADVTNYQEKNYYIHLQSYIHELIAYISLTLAFDNDISDFDISTDDRKWQSFGDIVVKVVMKRGNKKNKDYKTTNYAIKCKQISKSNKQIDSLSDAKISLDKEYASLTALKNVSDFTNTIFSIFTTCSVASKFCETEVVKHSVLKQWTNDEKITLDADFLVKPLTKRNDVLNITDEPDNVLTVYPKEKSEKVDLPKISIFTSQKVYPRMLEDVLKNTFKKREQIDREIQDYIKYIRHWADGNLGGHHYLNRNDVVLKIGEIFLDPYVAVPSKSLKPVDSVSNDFELWNGVVEKVDLIIMKNEPSIISKICEPFNQLIEKATGKIDYISNSIRLTEDIVNKISDDPMMKAYLFEEVDFSKNELRLPEVNISKLYKIFWKYGKIPLLLSTGKVAEDNDFLIDVISTMKSLGVIKKFLLITGDPFSVNTSIKNLSIFSRLEDIKDKVDLERVGLKSTSDYILTLKDISKNDQFFMKWVTPNIFFDMALGNYHFRADNSSRERTIGDMKIILDDATINEIRAHLSQSVTVAKEKSKGIDRGRLKGIDPDFFTDTYPDSY